MRLRKARQVHSPESRRRADRLVSPKVFEEVFERPGTGRLQLGTQQTAQLNSGPPAHPAVTAQQFPTHVFEMGSLGRGGGPQSPALGPAHLIQSLIQMRGDVEAIQHMQRLAGFGGDNIQVRLPHVAANDHVEQLVEKAIAEMQGKEYDATANLSELQSQSLALVKKAGDVAKVLDSHGVADALDALLGSYGLSHTYANASDVIVKLMALMNTSLKGVAYTKGDLRLLIDIVEYHAKDYVLTTKIGPIRTKQYLKKDDKTTNATDDQNKATDKIQPLISERRTI